MAQYEGEKRRRVSVACETCRKKKIKCDGERPCLSCRDLQLNCIYVPSQKRKTSPSLSSTAVLRSKVRELSSKLNQMENLIGQLATKLDPSALEGIIEELKVDEDEDEQHPLTERTTGAYLLKKGLRQGRLNSNDSNGGFDPNRVDQSVSDSSLFHSQIVGDNRVVSEQFYGPQSSLSLFAPRGLRWVQARLGNDSSLLFPLKDMNSYVHEIAKSNWKRWRDPISKYQLTPIPDRNITKLLSGYLFPVKEPFPFIDCREVEDMFARNYENSKLSSKQRHNPSSYADMSIINCVLYMAISMKLDAERTPEARQDKSSSVWKLAMSQQLGMTNDKILKLQNGFLDNAVYFFHKLCLGGNGIKGVQAVLLLLSCVERTSSSQVNIFLVSTIVRMAQEIGLNRRESLYGLDKKDTEKRKKVWWYCYYVDRVWCLRCGKPPLIRDDDISTPLPNEYESIFENRITKRQLPSTNGVDPIMYKLATKQGFNVYLHFYQLQLSQITSNGYEKLFAASALNGKTISQITEIISRLNKELEIFKESIDYPIRPGKDMDLSPYDNIESGSSWCNKLYDVLLIHFYYHFHVMLYNRVLFKTSIERDSDISVDIATAAPQNCLNAAREIIKLSLLIDIGAESFVSWCYPLYSFNAFLTLFCACLEYPDGERASQDLELMEQLVKHFFSHTLEGNVSWEYGAKLHEQLMKIVSKVIEKQSKVKNSSNGNIQGTRDARNEAIFSGSEMEGSNLGIPEQQMDNYIGSVYSHERFNIESNFSNPATLGNYNQWLGPVFSMVHDNRAFHGSYNPMSGHTVNQFQQFSTNGSVLQQLDPNQAKMGPHAQQVNQTFSSQTYASETAGGARENPPSTIGNQFKMPWAMGEW